MSILKRLKCFLAIENKVLIYNSLVVSHLNFGFLMWGFKYEKITKSQKKIIRILSLRKNYAHTEPLFKELKLLKIIDIFKLQELKFYYKYNNNKLPHYLQSLPFHTNTEPKIVNVTPNSTLDKIHTHRLQGFSEYEGTYFTILSGILCYGGLLCLHYANLIFYNEFVHLTAIYPLLCFPIS